MTIQQSELHYRLSGGTAQTNPHLSLGGAISNTVVVNGSFQNMFDSVSNIEATLGDVEYRCFYLRNNNITETLTNAKIWIASGTTSANDEIDIGIGSSAINGTEQIVPDESTSPASVSFSHPTSLATALTLGTLTAGSHRAFWLKRTVNAAASQFENNAFVLAVEGETI